MPRIRVSIFKSLSNRGYSVIEALTAAAIVATAATGTAGLVAYVTKQSQRARTLNRAMSIQSSIMNAMTDKTQFSKAGGGPRAALIDKLGTGSAADGLELVDLPDNLTNAKAFAIVGQRVGYSIDGSTGEMNTHDCKLKSTCPIWVDFDIRCGAMDTAGCRAAYRITVMPTPGQDVPTAPLGAAPGPPNADQTKYVGFANADYAIPLSYDFATQAPASDCKADNENVFITGVNRITGQVNCIAKQYEECPYPLIAHGLAVQEIKNKRRLTLQCHSPANAQCPYAYVFQKMDYGSQLDPGKDGVLNASGSLAGLKGICVYRWQNDIAWQRSIQTPPTASNISTQQKVCNSSIYNVSEDSGCQVVWDYNPGVPCARTCADGVSDCSYTAYATATPNGPAIGADNVATCSVTVHQQSCSGGTTNGIAHGVRTGKCTVKELKNNASLIKAPLQGTLAP